MVFLAWQWNFVPAAAAKEDGPRARQEQLLLLERASESLYQSMQNGRAEEAQKAMGTISSLIGEISYQGLTGVEGIHELTACVMDARSVLYKAEPSPEAWKTSSARLRLAVDSLIHVKGALWLQYYKVLTDDADQLSKASIQNDLQGVKRSFSEMRDHYEMIRSAAVIRKDPSEIAAVDSWMSYIEGLSGGNKSDLGELQKALAGGQGLLNRLFGKPREQPVLLPIAGYSNPWRWSLLIGVWILLALGYTAYRKYAAEQELQPVMMPKEQPSDKRT
nr:sporulation protein YpjB [Paenibacillus caui]